MNKVILIGRVGNDPEVKEVGSSKVCKFSLATSETYTKDGQKVTDTDWHNIVFWGKQCDTIQKYVHKGDLFCVTGKSKTRKYEDKNGVAHWATEIICNEFEFVQGKKDAEKSEDKQGVYQKSGDVEADIRSGKFENEPF